jgi:hypothetical protein
MAGRRRRARSCKPKRDPNLVESDQLDGLCWPTLRACWEGLSDAEIECRHRRAQQLVEGGWGAVEW